MEKVDVAIVGAGQAGLAVSWYLKHAGVHHVVLEAGRVAETWRMRRWDSFCLVTNNWTVKLPGAEYDGPDPEGFMSRGEVVDYFERWAGSFAAPVRPESRVSSLVRDSKGFVLNLPDRTLRAQRVVVATGAFQRAHKPSGGEGLSRAVYQVLAEDYRNPEQLPAGGVLIVGSGQTGCQLAEELHARGRSVHVACGGCAWTPRRIDGQDFVKWSADTGWYDRSVERLPNPTAARLAGNILATGNMGGHDMHYRTLHAQGVELLGHFAGADGWKAFFLDDLAASVDFGDARLRDWFAFVEGACKANGRPKPRFDWPAPFRVQTRTEIDLRDEGISTVIWTTGYRPDYRWVRLPVFDQAGFPVQLDGQAIDVDGLYFVGVHWLRKHKSSILYGVGEDAELVANDIIGTRR